MDPYMLDRLYHKDKRSGEDYSPNIDFWSIGCTLIRIACNCEAFASKTSDDLRLLHKDRRIDSIMGTKRGNNATFSSEFRKLSPINKTASPNLKECYLNIIKECFKPLDKRSADQFFGLVQEIKDIGLIYVIDINAGIGFYDLDTHENNDLDQEMFSLRSMEQYCQALKFHVPLRFRLNKASEIRIGIPPRNIVESDTYAGAPVKVIRSQCEAIQSIFALIEPPDFDITMLKHLCIIKGSDANYNTVEELYEGYDERRNSLFHRYNEIKQIYKDMARICRTTQLESLQTKCGIIEDEFRRNYAKQYWWHVYGKDGELGLLYKLCEFTKHLLLQQ